MTTWVGAPGLWIIPDKEEICGADDYRVFVFTVNLFLNKDVARVA